MRIAELFRSIQGEGRLTGTESIFVRASGCNLRCGYCDTPYASWTPEGEELSVDEIVARVDELRRLPRPSFLEQVGRDEVGWDEAQRSPTMPDGESGRTALAKSGGTRTSSHPTNEHPTNAKAGGTRTSSHPTISLSESGAGGEGLVRHIVLTGGEPMLFADLIPLTLRLRAAGLHITIETSGTLYLPVACDLMSISPKLLNSTPSPERDPRWASHHALNRHSPDAIRRLAVEYDCQWKFVIDCPADCREVESYLADFPQIERSHVMLMPQGIDAAALAEKAVWLKPYCVQQGFGFCARRQIEWFGTQRGT